MTNPHVQRFLELYKKWAPAYSRCVISVISSKKGPLLAGRLSLGATLSGEPQDFVAGGLHVRRFEAAPPTLSELVPMVSGGAIAFDRQEVRLQSGAPQGTEPNYYFRAHDGPEQPRYMPGVPILRISGAGLGTVLGAYGGLEELTGALQTHNPPYADLADLCDEYGLRSALGNQEDTFLEVCLLPPIAIHAATLDPEGRMCVAIDVARGIDLTTLQLGVRVLSGPRVIHRDGLRPADGSLVETPSGSRVQFEMRYGPEAQAADILLALENSIIARTRLLPDFQRVRASHILVRQIDPDFKKIRELLIGYLHLPHKDRNSRAFEGGVAVLLSLLGFRVTPLCAFPPYGQSADVCAWAPRGPLLLVEACTGTILADTPKIELLADRAAQLRQALQSEGHAMAVVPVFVTPYPMPHLENGLTLLERLEVALLDQEVLRELFSRVENGASPLETARYIETRVPVRDAFSRTVREMLWINAGSRGVEDD